MTINDRLSQLEERVEYVAQVGQEQIEALKAEVARLEERLEKLEAKLARLPGRAFDRPRR